MDFSQIALFRAIASFGGLTAAGRHMGMSPMAVSRALASLENEIGARLFHRTTRSLSLTPEGEAFLPYAASLSETHEAALNSVSQGGPGLHGVLKVTAPNVIGHSIVVPVLAKMMADNPSLRVDLTLADGLVDLVAAGLDVAIRVSPMELSDMITTRVAENPRVVCASPTYITRFGAPQTTDDLISHECIRLHNMDTWPFRVNGELRRLTVAGSFSASTVDAVRSACIEGMGIAMMTFWDVRQALRDEYLVELTFKDVEADQLGVWAVYPTKSHTPMRVHSLIEALRAHFSSMESEAV